MGGAEFVRKIEIASDTLDINWTETDNFYLKNPKKGLYKDKINKKFLLIGLDKEKKEVKLVSLISIAKGVENANKPCSKEIKSRETTVKAYEKSGTSQAWQKVQEALQDTGLWWKDKKILSIVGMFAFGNCREEFYKEGREVEVIDELKSEEKRVGLQKLEIEGGMQIINIQGIQNNQKEIIAPAILTKKDTSKNGLNLWAGLQGNGIVQYKEKAKKRERKEGQGFVVVHKTLTSFELEGNQTSLIEKTKLAEGVQKIPLKEGEYYLWDPSFTHIRNGKLETKDGQKLPWRADTNLPFRFNLVK